MVISEVPKNLDKETSVASNDLLKRLSEESDMLNSESTVREMYFEGLRGKIRTIAEHNTRLREQAKDIEVSLEDVKVAVARMRSACTSTVIENSNSTK